jgi:hypothetical protein
MVDFFNESSISILYNLILLSPNDILFLTLLRSSTQQLTHSIQQLAHPTHISVQHFTHNNIRQMIPNIIGIIMAHIITNQNTLKKHNIGM